MLENVVPQMQNINGELYLAKKSEGDDDGRDEWIFTKYAREVDKEETHIRQLCDHWAQAEKRTYTTSLTWHRLDKLEWEEMENMLSKKMQRTDLKKQISNMQSLIELSLRQHVYLKFQLSRCVCICVEGSQVFAENFFIEECSRIGASMSLFLWIIAPRINLKHAAFE